MAVDYSGRLLPYREVAFAVQWLHSMLRKHRVPLAAVLLLNINDRPSVWQHAVCAVYPNQDLLGGEMQHPLAGWRAVHILSNKCKCWGLQLQYHGTCRHINNFLCNAASHNLCRVLHSRCAMV